MADPPGLTVGAIVGRADVRDVLVARDGMTLADAAAGRDRRHEQPAAAGAAAGAAP